MKKNTHSKVGIIEQVSTSDNTSDKAYKPAPKKHRARIYMMHASINGFTENEILRHCRLSSARNYATELERLLGIRLERIEEKNPDGIGAHLRYRITCRSDAMRIIQLVNKNASAGGYDGLSQQAIADILSLYPDTFIAE